MKFSLLLLLTIGVCTACMGDEASDIPRKSDSALPEQRIIAEVYRVIEVANIGCYIKPNAKSYRLASLSHGQTVYLKLEGQQSVWQSGELWLHVEQAVEGGDPCFIRAQYLEPTNE